jgi:hypothetical protein
VIGYNAKFRNPGKRGGVCNQVDCLSKFVTDFLLDPKATVTQAGKVTMVAGGIWESRFEYDYRLALIRRLEDEQAAKKDKSSAWILAVLCGIPDDNAKSARKR